MPQWSINDISDPLVLEIHRSVEVRTTGTASLPVLPAYVRREHDDVLDALVVEAAAGHSRLVCVVGESSTGKTRACWEAVRKLPDGWELWQPVAPGRGQALRDGLASVGPRTVVWLNEAQLFLLTPAGGLRAELAAGLRELLSDPKRAPVLVVATLWPGYWHELTSLPADGSREDEHSEARALLSGRDVQVAARFRPDEVAAARRAGQSDPRLTLAVENANEGQVVQYLAGAPALLSRYESAPVGARSLMTAAMDARRLGHGPSLSYGLLAEGAEGYLTDEEWDSLAEDWLETALAHVASPVTGVRGALVRRRPRARRTSGGAASGEFAFPHYRLADYLDQHGRLTRQDDVVPSALWEALLVHGDRSGFLSLGESAQNRGLLRVAALFYAQADGGAEKLAQLLNDCGRQEEARPWWIRSATEQAGSFALSRVVQGAPCGTPEEAEEILKWWWDEVPKERSQGSVLSPLVQRMGPVDDPRALLWWRRAAEQGHTKAEETFVGHLRATGGPDAVLAWYRERGADGRWCPGRATDLLIGLGRAEEALTLLSSSDEDDVHSFLRLGELLLERGEERKAVEWLARAGRDSGSTGERAARVLFRMGRDDVALEALGRAAEDDDHALVVAARVLDEAGRHAESLHWWRRAASVPRPGSWVCLQYAGSLARNEELPEALVWYQRAVEGGERRFAQAVDAWELELLASQGKTAADLTRWRLTYAATTELLGKPLRRWTASDDEKLSWLLELTENGHPSAIYYAVSRLCDAGREGEALDLALAQAERGHDRAPGTVAELYSEAGELESALQWWERSARHTGHRSAAYSAGGRALREAGRTEEATAWFRRAVEAGDVDLLWLTVELYETLERHGEALAWLWQLAVRGWPFCVGLAADVLRHGGEEREAERLRRYGWEPDGSTAAAWTAPLPS
ncbi:tetratricopeptide repeat protein [Streptomyces sp. NPDC020731]|uniref:tetratricopeptide repeat protein n=1 Tax=Streptomyces sp. NPDC020731 TaxID=3365085 RepID=UPI00378A2A20